jgi:nicotinamide riboside kinase
MKLTISGAQSTGKTTLINALFDLPEIKNRFQLRNEVTRNVLRDKFGLGSLDINEKGTDNTQLMICSQHLINYVASNTDTIFDRSALDGLVYTTYLYNHGKVNQNTLRIAESLFENLKYDMIFYVKPEIPLVDDGERSVAVDFYNEIVSLFEEYIKVYKLHMIFVSGTVDDRVKQVLSFIEMYDKYQREKATKIANGFVELDKVLMESFKSLEG